MSFRAVVTDNRKKGGVCEHYFKLTPITNEGFFETATMHRSLSPSLRVCVCVTSIYYTPVAAACPLVSEPRPYIYMPASVASRRVAAASSKKQISIEARTLYPGTCHGE